MGKSGSFGKRSGKHYDFSVRLYEYILPAVFERLSGNEVKLLLYMMSFEKGANNGEIIMAVRQAALGIGVSEKTALTCLRGLDRAGFIRPTERGFFAVKGGPATTWRFTFMAAFGKPPTNEWKKPVAEHFSWWEFLPGAVGEITPAASKCVAAVGKTTPALNGKPPKLELVAVVETPTQTVAIGKGPEPEGLEGGSEPEIENGPPTIQNEPIRRQVRAVWLDLGMKARRSLARTAGLSPEQLQDYVRGHLALPAGKQHALRCAALAAA